MQVEKFSETEREILRIYTQALTGLPHNFYQHLNFETQHRIVTRMNNDLENYYQERRESESAVEYNGHSRSDG